MRYNFLSFLALANAVIVTETDYATFYVTVTGPSPTSSSSLASGVTSSAVSASAAVANENTRGLSEVVVLTTSTFSSSSTPSTTSTSTSSTSTSSTSSTKAPAPSTTSTSVVPPVQVTTSEASSSSSSLSTTTSSSQPTTTNAFEADIVSYHNRVRGIHKVGPVTWSDDLANYAQTYLNGDNCVFKHSGGPYGENIAIGYPTIDAALDAWYDEEDQYDYSAGQFSESTGHFTQMVWKGSNQVGCATYDCSGRTFLACEYYPRGNYIGEFTENVFA